MRDRGAEPLSVSFRFNLGRTIKLSRIAVNYTTQKNLCISVEAVENSRGPAPCTAENFGRHSGCPSGRGDGFRETPPGWQRPEERISSGARSKSRASSRQASA